MHRQFLRVLLSASALGFVTMAEPADAQRIDRIIAFGDSYADTGNAFRLQGINPITTQVYTTGRFSGGTNYIDTLSQILGVPVYNYAVGGARTITAPNRPGLDFQVSTFLSNNTVGGVFPAIGGVLDENDLVTISIGANDARAYQQGGGTVAGAGAAAATSVGAASVSIGALVAAGAPTISFMTGDASRLPEVDFLPDPAAARAVRTAFAGAFQTGIQDVLAGHAANGVMVHYLDLNLIFDQIQANLAAYGLTGLACPAFPPPVGPGVPGNTICAVDPQTAAQFAFYGDQLHLTSAGFAIVARYVATQLQAPLTLEATSELALDTAQQFARTLSSRMDFAGEGEQGLKFFLVGDAFSNESDEDDHSDAFDVDGVGVTAGLTYGFGNGLAGLAVNYSRPRAEFDNEAAETRSRSFQIGGFAGFDMGGGFAQAYLGYGNDDHDIDRRGVVEGMSASPGGSHWLAGAKAGYLLSSGDFRFGPVVGLDYARAKVDGYTEDGDPALTLTVDSVSAKSLIGSLGAELQGEVDAGGMKVKPMVAIALEKELADTGRTVHFAQTSAPGIVNRWKVGDSSNSPYGRLSGGFAASILEGVELDAQASLTLGREEGEESGAHVGLRIGF